MNNFQVSNLFGSERKFPPRFVPWKWNIIWNLLFVILIFIFSSCKKDIPFSSSTVYPPEINKIILTHCAVSGCHNDQSKDAVGGLSFENWETMMKGGRNGAVVIPYSPGESPMFIFTNTDEALGPAALPTMPYGKDPLTHDQVLTIKNWISSGAPNGNGFVKFSDNPDRKKVYITNQGCDLVAVMDMESNLVMRYIPVGSSAAVKESPHALRVSPDGKYWYVSFTAGTVVQKFSASDDRFAGEAMLGSGSWNAMIISPDGTKALVVDWSAAGSFVVLDLNTMTV